MAEFSAIEWALTRFALDHGDGLRIQKLSPDGQVEGDSLDLAVEGITISGSGAAAEEREPTRFKLHVSSLETG